MAYDRADWHYGGNYPKELPPENGGTHIGLFLAWIIHHDLFGDFHKQESLASVSAVKERRMTGREFLFKVCDEKFWEEDLSEEGNQFAKAYYSGQNGESYGRYLGDYQKALAGDLPSLYHVEDSWESYDKLAPIISRRFSNWKKTGTVDDPFKPWWKIW